MQPMDGRAGFDTKTYTHHRVGGSNRNAKCERRGGLFVANATHHRRSSSLACKCKSRIFAQQELNSCWVMFLVDRRAYTCRIGDVLAHLHIWLNRHADYFACSSPSLACKWESEDFLPMRGVRLPHGASFECERDQTCCYCSTFVSGDI